MTTESKVSASARLLAPKYGARLFRNQVGQYPLLDGRILRSGVGVGSPDLVGWQTITVTPDMVGQRVAVFLGIEAKSPGRKASQRQNAWLDAIREAGGRAGVVQSDSDTLALLLDSSPGTR